jgi:GNAT superfamily N-acetyltransferase
VDAAARIDLPRPRRKEPHLIELVDVTDDQGRVVSPEWLAKSEAVHRQLRKFSTPYAVALAEVFAGGGRMRVAVVDGEVAGVAVHRTYVNTSAGKRMYVDDLVTDEARRSSGVGAALLRSLETTARAQGCRLLTLDSGTWRRRAHGFYLREGMEIDAFHFTKPLDP